MTALISYFGKGKRGEFSGGDIASLGVSTSQENVGMKLPNQETSFFGTVLDKVALGSTRGV